MESTLYVVWTLFSVSSRAALFKPLLRDPQNVKHLGVPKERFEKTALGYSNAVDL